ncbi:uncharacterized protein LOC135586193 [Musa acuminata AAA Group]|uniref:uncharacterized protein LOC135586193 n=1 Tax=Musa acuminata AAA Group TaxID=214697 RepID=UPI0031E469F8
MVRKYHPDVSPPDCAEYTRRFIEVQEAYETLSDPRRGCVSLSPPGGGLMRYRLLLNSRIVVFQTLKCLLRIENWRRDLVGKSITKISLLS